MNLELRNAIVSEIRRSQHYNQVFSSLNYNSDGTGTITYNGASVWRDPKAPGFTGTTTQITDEELVRAYLILQLVSKYNYTASSEIIEIEKVYKSVGRLGKGGRVDVLVRRPSIQGRKESFLFIECKAPDAFDSDIKMIDGQLFRLSKQELPRPRFLVYYTVELKAQNLRERIILIDTQTFPEFEDWDRAGQPITDNIPIRYGNAQKKRFANVMKETNQLKPLDKETTPSTFHRLRTEIHDVIWGGGGTNNNEVFITITKLILCKIFDEKETNPSEPFRFQRFGDALAPETASSLVERLNDLYKDAEAAYLALPQASIGPAFDISRVSAEKIAFVVGRLEPLSITENNHQGDLLGEFFEQIVAQDFTQTKGQFFTPIKLVRFMLHLANTAKRARDTMTSYRDHLGRPRLPYVIDPSCGSGTFLIEYMKLVRREIGQLAVAQALPNRVREMHSIWFAGNTGNNWAKDYLFGVENNYDLGLAAKVNMVLHGDGSMNTWIKSGLLPFEDYWVQGRNNLLGTVKISSSHPYSAALNEQFDLILSNPPFSIKLPPDEKTKVGGAFAVMASAQSEAIFIERWYQLLREGGEFCAILPETILDTSSYITMRNFLIKHFKVIAVVSLPYDAFRPFTSTKTCILYAQKRSSKEIVDFETTLEQVRVEYKLWPLHRIFQEVLRRLGWDEESIFMAEPVTVGYKRRKNLSDLPTPNQLYRETHSGDVDSLSEGLSTVLDYYRSSGSASPHSQLGFWTKLRNVTNRDNLRLDPKYRWLWDFQDGIVLGNSENAVELSSFLSLTKMLKVAKGELAEDTSVIDLEYVESRQAIVRDEVPIVDVIGSDKVSFQGCDLVISKLEPYLGKVIINPIGSNLGSTEWIGLRIKNNMPSHVAGYILMLPELCDGYRRLQSGKRHARFEPTEFLKLKIKLPSQSEWDELEKKILQQREKIIELRNEEQVVRRRIDSLFEM